MIEQLIKAIMGSNGEEDFEAAIAKMQRRSRMEGLADTAAGFMILHKEQGKPCPVAGQKIRCTFSVNETFDQRGVNFAPVDGRVYNVKASSTDAESVSVVIEFFESIGMPSFIIDELRNNPENKPCHLVIEDPLNGELSLTAYPAFGGVTWMEAADDAIDIKNYQELAVGDNITPVLRSAMGDAFTPGKAYAVEEAKPVCTCGDSECPGKDLTTYVITDDEGDKAQLSFPFSPYGEFKKI